MYKVFFNDRVVLLTDDFLRNFQARYGLFYKYRNVDDLHELITFYRDLKRIDTLYIFHNDLDELQERFKSCFQVIEAAGGLVTDTKGRYLVIKRRGIWDLPKGKLNKGETIPQAALREVSEECGIKQLEIVERMMSTWHCYWMDGQPVLKRTSWFEMVTPGDEKLIPQRDEDITEVKWVSRQEMAEISKNTYMTIIDLLKYKNLL